MKHVQSEGIDWYHVESAMTSSFHIHARRDLEYQGRKQCHGQPGSLSPHFEKGRFLHPVGARSAPLRVTSGKDDHLYGKP